MSLGDFHTHSTRSDGRRTPTELVDLAVANGVGVLALTDHDTLAGWEEARTAAARYPDLVLVPGIELSCDVPGGEVHMLGLGVRPDDSALLAELERLRTGRVDRARGMVERLTALGYPLEWERVRAIAGDASVGRPHVAQALLEAGHIAEFGEAFDHLIGRNGPAYVERARLAPAEAVAMIHAAGGLAVYAHPGRGDDHEGYLRETAAAGLFGVEVYYRDYDAEQREALRVLADDLGLFALGGSDYHGIEREGEREPGRHNPPPEMAVGFVEALLRHGCAVYRGSAALR